MSWEIANSTHSLGQFASNCGLTDLIEAAKDSPNLKKFFERGYTQDVPACVAELEALEGDQEVESTAKILAALIDGQGIAIITDGLVAE